MFRIEFNKNHKSKLERVPSSYLNVHPISRTSVVREEAAKVREENTAPGKSLVRLANAAAAVSLTRLRQTSVTR